MDGFVRWADEDVATSHAAISNESVAYGDEPLDRLTKLVLAVDHHFENYFVPAGSSVTVARE